MDKLCHSTCRCFQLWFRIRSGKCHFIEGWHSRPGSIRSWTIYHTWGTSSLVWQYAGWHEKGHGSTFHWQNRNVVCLISYDPGIWLCCICGWNPVSWLLNISIFQYRALGLFPEVSWCYLVQYHFVPVVSIFSSGFASLGDNWQTHQWKKSICKKLDLIMGHLSKCFPT